MDRDGPYGPNGQQALPQKSVLSAILRILCKNFAV